MLIRLLLPLDFLFDLREMIIGVTERIVDLRGGEGRIGLPDGLHSVSSLRR